MRTVRCARCELVQWPVGEKCRRCEAVLPRPLVVYVDREVEKIAEVRCPKCGNLYEALPTLKEAEDALIALAYERCGNDGVKAAAMLGIGKTTVYRRLRKMQGRAA